MVDCLEQNSLMATLKAMMMAALIRTVIHWAMNLADLMESMMDVLTHSGQYLVGKKAHQKLMGFLRAESLAIPTRKD